MNFSAAFRTSHVITINRKIVAAFFIINDIIIGKANTV